MQNAVFPLDSELYTFCLIRDKKVINEDHPFPDEFCGLFNHSFTFNSRFPIAIGF